MQVETITRDEYKQLQRHDYAGPKSSLMAVTQDYWPASHWVLKISKRGGTELVPVNIT